MAAKKSSLYKTNWNKFEEAVNDVVRKEVCRVFLWLYQGGSKHVGQYLDEIPGGKAGLNKDEKATLAKKEPPTNMDITLLYRLLQRTCGLAEASDPTWVSPPDPNSHSLEHTLYLIKAERNTVSHEGHTRDARHMSEADLDRKLGRLRGLCADLLLEASRGCGRESQADGHIKTMEDRLQEIQGVTADRFMLMAREERLKATPTKIADKWYQQPLLRLQSRGVELADLLPRQAADGAATGSLLVSGEAGVGKSSLCRYLEQCWLRPRSDGKDLLQRYRLVLRVHCRDICTCDALRLLEELLPEAASRCNSDRLSEILRSVPILWLLDGLDEATDEATKLLSSLLRNKRRNSTVLVTSRPEFARDFLQRHHNDGIQLVSLLGADPREAIHRVIQFTKPDEDTARHADSLMQEFERLDWSVQQELQNPLKLRLALHGWETMRTSTLRREFELGPLYHKITKAQIESLSEKLSKESPMTKSEATRKVGKWFSCLCESTFSLVQSREGFVGVAAGDDFFRKLEDKCDDLKISFSKCLSTFLASPDSMFSTGNNSYTFYHDSQVHFLAARHIASVMKGSTDLLTDTLTLFNIAALQEQGSNAPPLLHFLHVLLLLVSLIDASTPDDNTAMAIKLLLNAIPLEQTHWKWFDVARKASYKPKVMREIGRVIPEFWIINEPNYEAARKMLEYRQPKVVSMLAISKPEEVSELEPLIRTLASFPISLLLDLVNYITDISGNDTADYILKIICSKKSRCELIEFRGHLSNKGYDLLKHPNISDSCGHLALKVTSIRSIEILCKRVKCFKYLKHVQLEIAMMEIPNTSAKFPNSIDISIYLSCLMEKTAAKIAKSIAQLSLSYGNLGVYDTEYNVIETFLMNLAKRSVTAKAFCGRFQVTEKVPYDFEFGPLPLEYPPEEFRRRWSSYRSLVRKTQPTRDA